jgi:hypothetical protein
MCAVAAAAGWPAAVLGQGADATRDDGATMAGGRPVHEAGHIGAVRGRQQLRWVLVIGDTPETMG